MSGTNATTSPAGGTSWLPIYIGICSLLVINTTLYPIIPEFSQKWRTMGPFSLAAENNFAVWWSGISLFCAGLLSFELFSKSHRGLGIAWFGLCFLFVGLAADELGSFHERLGSWSDLAPYGAVIGIVLMFALKDLFIEDKTKRTAAFVFGGFFLFGLTALQEKIEHAVNWPEWAMGPRVGIEEGTELIAIILIFYGLTRQRLGKKVRHPLSIITPNPNKMAYMPLAFLVGLIGHLVIILFVMPAINDGRGDPSALFPSFCFFTLACAYVWKYWVKDDGYKTRHLVLALFFLACSAGSVFNYWNLIPGGQRLMSMARASNTYLLIGVHLLVLAVLLRREIAGSRLRANMTFLVITAALVGVCAVAGGDVDAFVWGVFPYLVVLATFKSKRGSGKKSRAPQSSLVT